ncbi:MAG: hypothetical protein AAF533_18485 [Acidobacteriota bacterium]
MQELKTRLVWILATGLVAAIALVIHGVLAKLPAGEIAARAGVAALIGAICAGALMKLVSHVLLFQRCLGTRAGRTGALIGFMIVGFGITPEPGPDANIELIAMLMVSVVSAFIGSIAGSLAGWGWRQGARIGPVLGMVAMVLIGRAEHGITGLTEWPLESLLNHLSWLGFGFTGGSVLEGVVRWWRYVTDRGSGMPFDPDRNVPGATTLASELVSGRWQGVSQRLASTANSGDRSCLIEAIADQLESRPASLDEWLEEHPEDPGAWLMSGRQAVEWAWQGRGYGKPDGVTREGWRLFRERLVIARDHLVEAARLAPQDAAPFGELIGVAMGLSAPAEDKRGLFDAAMQRDPTHWRSCQAMVLALTKKWGASHEEMFDFAREVAARAPEGSPLHGVILHAHFLRHDYADRFDEDEDADEYWDDRQVRKEIAAAYREGPGSPRFRDAPQTVQQLNRFAYTLGLVGEWGLSRHAFELIGNRRTEWPWDGRPGMFEHFRKRARA